MGGDLIQILKQYGGARIDPRESGGGFGPGGGGNFDGALGLANGGAMPIRGGGGYGGGATSPFEVGGNSGGPVSAGNGYGGAQLPGGYQGPPPGGPYQNQSGPRPNNWIGGWGGLPEGYSGPVGSDGRPLPYNPDGSQQQASPPWMQRRNPGTRDDMRRGYWGRGMNDQGGQQQMPPRPMGGYWQRPMGGPMPGQGVPLGGGGREMPMPPQAPPQGMPVTQGGMIKSAAPQQQQSYQPAQAPAPAQAPSQPVRRATRDDNNARGWSGYA